MQKYNSNLTKYNICNNCVIIIFFFWLVEFSQYCPSLRRLVERCFSTVYYNESKWKDAGIIDHSYRSYTLFSIIFGK